METSELISFNEDINVNKCISKKNHHVEEYSATSLAKDLLDNCIIAAMQVKVIDKMVQIGFAAFNTEKCSFKFCEYTESNFCCDITENISLQLRPRSICIYIPPDCPEERRILDIFQMLSIDIIAKKKRDFLCLNIEANIESLLLDSDSIKNYTAMLREELCIGCISCLLSEYGILSNNLYYKSCTFSYLFLDVFLRLDKAAFTALHVYPQKGEGKCNYTSLLGFLNRCKTKIGFRKLVLWISQPLTDKEEIRKRHDMLQIFLEDEILRNKISSTYLSKVPDLDTLAGKLKRFFYKNRSDENDTTKGIKIKITLEEVVRLYDCVVSGREMLFSLSSYTGSFRETLKSDIILPLRETLDNFVQFIKLVEQIIDLEEAVNGNFLISRNFDENLKALAEEKDNTKNDIFNLRQKVEDSIPFNRVNKKSSNTLSTDEIVKICESGTEGFVFRVTKRDQHAVQQVKGRFQQLRVNKGELLFTNGEMRSLCKKYEEACRMYNEAQAVLVEKVLAVVSTYWSLVEMLSSIYSSVDVFVAFAIAISSTPNAFCRPFIDENGETLKLIESRHLLVEMAQKNTYFIPNDTNMNKKNAFFHIITGPNMGGKSTYIRQVAMIVLLNQIGFYVPCKYAEIPIFKKIMCRVGASDNQLRGVSTFLSEMTEAAAILKTACEKSLVIIDELGRGTSTYDGFGLAWAIAKYIAERIRCFCFFATHFHELGQLADICTGVKNYHVDIAFNMMEGKLTFLYKIKSGCADKSYGVHVAEMARLPSIVTDRAREKSKELEYVEKYYALRIKRKLKYIKDDKNTGSINNANLDQMNSAICGNEFEEDATFEAFKKLKNSLIKVLEQYDLNTELDPKLQYHINNMQYLLDATNASVE